MANATIIYACTQEGLVILTRPGTLTEWLPPRRVLAGQHVASAWGEPGPPIRVLAVADGKLLLSENGGRSWEPVAIGPAVTCILQVGEPPNLYVGTGEGRLWMSRDSGATWDELAALPTEGAMRALLADGNAPSHFYALQAQEDGMVLLQGDAQAGEWRTLHQQVTALAEDAGTSNLYACIQAGVQVSSDGGAAWATLPGSPHDGTAILAVPGPPGKHPALVVGTRSGLALSLDGGTAWQTVDLPRQGGVAALARDPERRDRIYTATDAGYLFESGNRGQAWQPVNAAPLPPASYLYVVRI